MAIKNPGRSSNAKAAETRKKALELRPPVLSCPVDREQVLIWVKNSSVMGRQDYHWQHKPILYGWKPGTAHVWYGERNKKTVIGGSNHTESFCLQEELTIETGG